MRGMTKTALMFGAGAVGLVIAGQGLAALFLMITFLIFYQLHTLEVKLNKLLDDRDLIVTDEDYER